MLLRIGSILEVADNSGAKKVNLINIYGGSKIKTAKIGSLVKISVRETYVKSKVPVHKIYKALLIRTKTPFTREDQTKISFEKNEVVLLNDNLEPISTRVIGFVLKELKKKYSKILFLAEVIG